MSGKSIFSLAIVTSSLASLYLLAPYLFEQPAIGKPDECRSHFVTDYKRVNGKVPARRDVTDYCDCWATRLKFEHPVQAHQFCLNMIDGIS